MIASRAAVSALLSLSPGSVFAGDYRVLRPLSEGGMGAVYVVEQISTGYERALKLMRPQLVADPRLRQRFEQEAKASARIKSAHGVQVIAAGVDAASGTPWLSMELLEGEDLASYSGSRGPLPKSVVREIFAQLCDALTVAHRVVVHRDLKPENLFLSISRRTGVAFTLKILDFGIAKMVAESQVGVTSAIGSPLWMAPEQASTESIISPTADIWPLGLIAFHLLTGHHYWRSGQARESSPAAVMKEMLFDPIDPPSMRAEALGLAATIPAGFDAWFSRCVHRDPAARYASASAAFAELDPVLAASSDTDVPVGSLPPNLAVRSRTQVPTGSAAASGVPERTEVGAFVPPIGTLADPELAIAGIDGGWKRRVMEIGAVLLVIVAAASGVVWFLRQPKPRVAFDYGDYAPLVKEYESQLGREPCDREVTMKVVEIMQKSGDTRGILDRGETFFGTAKCGEYAPLRVATSEAHRRLNELDLAIADLGKLIDAEPQNLDYVRRRARTYKEFGKGDLAAVDYRHILSLAPDDAWALKQLLELLEEHKKTCEAVTAIRDFLAVNPKAYDRADYEGRMQLLDPSNVCGK